ncbi:MAG: ABC transporter ATP-binding protein [Lachnospiraceae bacterium]|nr:ABC transporter ATP-binding protein [Lachnospiraceae bacterium]
MENPVIRIDHLTKIYKLYDKPSDRLKEALGLSRKKKYKELRALNDVSFEVNKGETVGIIGTNGSGKSTILKIITGVLAPTSGTVTANGRISALLELGAGFNMEYTGIENIYLNGTMMGFSKEEIDAKLDDILSFADIGDFVNQPVKTYSSGMFVRLAFALSINIDPEILIVDEALSVGDVFFQSKCYHKFEEFRKAGKTILFVSHDLSSVSKYCDRVVLLNKGVKMAEGEPKQIVDLYKKLLVDYGDSDTAEEESEPTVAEIAAKQEGSNSLTGILPMNPNMLEYGEHQATFTKITTFDEKGTITNSVEKGAYFTIQARIHFHRDVEDPICAFTFKDLKGTEICGTNTLFEGHDIGSMKAGQDVVVRFRQKMDLQGGEYLLSFGCTGYHEGEFRVFQRLYDILNVTVVSVKNTVGFYDMNSEVTVEY